MVDRFNDNPAYIEYETLLRRLHDVAAEFGNDSDEADAVRDQMDGPERHLNRPEKDRLNGLSGDLYMLSGEEILAQPPVADTQDELRELIAGYERANDWDSVLALLRRRPPLVSENAVAFTRARAYGALGHHETALRFFQHLIRRVPVSPDFQAMHLFMLKKAGRDDEAIDLANRHSSSPSVAPVVLIASAVTRFEISGSREADRVIASLTRALKMWKGGFTTPVGYVVLAHLLKAQCLMSTGSPAEAVAELDEALELRPNDAAIMEVRDVVLASRSAGVPVRDVVLTSQPVDVRQMFKQVIDDTSSTIRIPEADLWGKAA